MKKIIILMVLVFCALCIHRAKGQETQKNVEDYFLIMPSNYWDLNEQVFSDKQKMLMIDEKDIKNGWLKFSGKDASNVWEGWGEFVIFKKPDKSYMMAVTILSCGPECSQTIKFYELNNQNWKEVTLDVFQPLTTQALSAKYKALVGTDDFADNPPVIYVLPRYGTTINVVTQEDITGHKIILASYSYVNGKFLLKN
ncbi:MAG: hypothetical protein WCQ95_09160 [Bacteroidota bacterium]